MNKRLYITMIKTARKMKELEIPMNNIKKYLKETYSFLGRITLLPSSINTSLDELSLNNIKGKKAIKNIEKKLDWHSKALCSSLDHQYFPLNY
tara:strand:- start:10810 stop:11088 length:279 start_codon:yes stop_codon:yes gene_type:complete